jgi:aryl-alcohol dehydrogenase-like predicted oxidoreductase
MALTGVYGHLDRDTAVATIRRALDLGIDHFDTAELYGPFRNEALLAAALGRDAARVTIATKVGYRLEGGQIAGLDSRPAQIRAAVEGCLRRLGRDTVDLLYQHRPDPEVPVEDAVGAMSDLVEAGKVRWLGLSATDAATLSRAQTVHPIAAVQNEYSLLERAPEDGLLDAVAQAGAVFVAYSPLGRGRLAGSALARTARAPDDYRRSDKRFAEDALEAAGPLTRAVSEIAEARGVAPAAIALAWLLARHPHIRAIPGARSPGQVETFWSGPLVRLTPSEVARLAQPEANAAG